jgi:leader peptidase (prepilin peptidase)/N-methyltransferase
LSPPLLAGLAVGGVGVGWFLNTVIVRAPDGRSLLHPGPECPECEARLHGVELLPIVSWVALRGRCRHCGEAIPAGYPIVELANAVLWVLAGVRFGASLELVPYLVLFSVLLTQSVIDLELYRLLDRITYPALAVLLVLVVLVGVVDDRPDTIRNGLIGMVLYVVFLLVPALVNPRGMGLGDVKLAAPMGLMLGRIHVVLVLDALIFACVLGLVVGVVLYLARGRQSHAFPFGPWLALGCVLAVLFTVQLIS